MNQIKVCFLFEKNIKLDCDAASPCYNSGGTMQRYFANSINNNKLILNDDDFTILKQL